MGSENLPPFRADHVGSLLRPASLLEARAKSKTKEISPTELHNHENDCIREVVKMQESLGLQSATDGEFRRENFHTDFISQIEGVEFRQIFTPGGTGSEEHQAPFVAMVSKKMSLPEKGIEVDNFRYLNSISTTATAKQTLPSPTMTHFRGGRKAIDKVAYPELEEFYFDLARVYQEEIKRLTDAGCRYLQLDDTNLAYLCDKKMRSQVEERGDDPKQLPHDYAKLINQSIRERPDDVVVCIHTCRGNARSRWFAEGGYESIAEVVFNEMEVDGFFLEYDDKRSGNFEPLRFVPKNKKIVLGLVTTKQSELETRDTIKRRIEEATKYIDIDQLCLSPQCGFASNADGNLLSEDDEKTKLSLIVRLADEIWS